MVSRECASFPGFVLKAAQDSPRVSQIATVKLVVVEVNTHTGRSRLPKIHIDLLREPVSQLLEDSQELLLCVLYCLSCLCSIAKTYRKILLNKVGDQMSILPMSITDTKVVLPRPVVEVGRGHIRVLVLFRGIERIGPLLASIRVFQNVLKIGFFLFLALSCKRSLVRLLNEVG